MKENFVSKLSGLVGIFMLIALVYTCSGKNVRNTEGTILFQNDTIDVAFVIPKKNKTPNYEQLQYKVKYYDDRNMKRVLKPNQAVEIQFRYENENIRILSRKNTIGARNGFRKSERIFLKLEMDGYLKLFEYYITKYGPYGSVSNNHIGRGVPKTTGYILQKGNGELRSVSVLTFKKDMIDYFSDCPELLQIIENKDFQRDDMEAIVKFYNSKCTK